MLFHKVDAIAVGCWDESELELRLMNDDGVCHQIADPLRVFCDEHRNERREEGHRKEISGTKQIAVDRRSRPDWRSVSHRRTQPENALAECAAIPESLKEDEISKHPCDWQEEVQESSKGP